MEMHFLHKQRKLHAMLVPSVVKTPLWNALALLMFVCIIYIASFRAGLIDSSDSCVVLFTDSMILFQPVHGLGHSKFICLYRSE